MKASVDKQQDQHQNQSGMTIVELGIASVLVLAIIGLTHSSTIAVHSATQYSEKRLAQEASSRTVLETIKRDLRDATVEKDPKTNLYRYSISTNKWLKQQLDFQKLEGADIVGTEVEPVWSSSITLTVNDKNQVVRTQDGNTRILGVGVKDIFFETTLSGKFKVTAVTSRPDRKGKTMDVHEVMYVKPKN